MAAPSPAPTPIDRPFGCGHPRTPENSYTAPGHYPCCVACASVRSRDRHARERAERRATRATSLLVAACYACLAPCTGDHWCIGQNDHGDNAICALCEGCWSAAEARQRVYRASHPPRHVRTGRGMASSMRMSTKGAAG